MRLVCKLAYKCFLRNFPAETITPLRHSSSLNLETSSLPTHREKMANPQNRPSIPPFIPSENVVVIIDFITQNTSLQLHDTAIRRTIVVRRGNVVASVQVLLFRSAGMVEYVFGRQSKGRNPKSPDVHLPDLNAGQQQFKLVPDWETNSWRVHAMSETMVWEPSSARVIP
jgi:hypothetical protein